MNIYPIDSLPARITLGRQTENGVSQIRIDCSTWRARWPNLTISVWVTPPGGADAYPAKTVMDGDTLVWTISSADTAAAGNGTMEIAGMLGDLKKLSAVTMTYISASTTVSPGEAPEAHQGWVDQVLSAGASAEQSAVQAKAAADRAEQAAAESGYMDFYIDDAGHLQMVRTENVDVTFELEDGRLIINV